MTSPIRRRTLLGVLGIMPLVWLATVQPVSAATGTTTTTATSDISLHLVATRGSVATGQRITYIATMINHGPNDATFVDANFVLPAQLDLVSMTCDKGISPDTPSCEYSSLKAGEKVVSVLVAKPHRASYQHDRQVRVTARVLFEVDCSFDPNCTFDPHMRNDSDSVTTRLNAR